MLMAAKLPAKATTLGLSSMTIDLAIACSLLGQTNTLSPTLITPVSTRPSTQKPDPVL